MTITLTIPITHRSYTDGRKTVEVEAMTVGEAVEALCTLCPAMGPELLTGSDVLRPDIEISINQCLIPGKARDQAFDIPLKDGDQVLLSSIIAGG
ncbi:MAG: hypothetical protein MI747_22435 [Desulfobacterales bacterium]|nr:hypothetical protein [Desulfobacterales bacterium]